MAITNKTKLNYRCPERLWIKIKQYNILLNNNDLNKTVDDLCKKGIETFENERK